MSSTAESVDLSESTQDLSESSLSSGSEQELDVEDDDKPYAPASGVAAGSSSVAVFLGTTIGKVAIGAAVAVISLVILSVVLTLPENVTCDADVERYFIRLADPPSLSAVEPSLVCTADGARDVLLGGGGFLRFNGAEPAVSIDGEAVEFDIENPSCSAVDVRRQDVETCESMRLTLPQQDAAEFEYPNVSVVWPEREGDHATANIPDDEKSCAMSSTLVLVRVPPPDVFDIFPPAVCEQTTRELTLTGEYLLRLTPGNFQTQVAINEVPVAATDTLLRGCFNSTVVPAYTRVRNCSTIDLVVNASTLVRGLHNVSVVNPQPAGCVGRQTDQFLVVQAPVVTSIQPPIACVEQANRTVRLNGSGFLRIDGSISTVTIADIPVVVSSHGSCVDLAVKGHNVSTCGFVDVILAAADFGPLAVAGSTQPIVRVTPPFLPECLQTFATNLLTLVPPPDLFDVNPPAVCADTERVLVLSGEYFLRLALEGSPTSQTTVTIDGTSAIPFANTTLSGCTVSDDVPTYTQVESCSTISIQVRTNDYAVGLHNVSVENPQPAGCIGRQTDQFLVVEAPVVTSIGPPIACVEQADRTVRLHGSGFLQVDGVVSIVAIANIDVAVTSHGGCLDLPVKGHNVSTCSFVDILLASADLAGLTDSGAVQPEVRVTPPFLAECTQTFATGLLTLVPPPEATAALPPVMCGTPQEIVIEGNYFIVLGNGSVSEQPIVTITVPGVLAAELVVDATAVTPENCTALQVDGSFYSDSRICSFLRIAVPSNEVRSMTGALNATRGIIITNPTPAGCSSTPAMLVDVLTPPTVDAVMPDESCLEGQERILLINGTGFARVTASGTILLPSVTVGGWTGGAETASGCLQSRDPTVELCSVLTVRIPVNAPVANVAGGFVDVSVLNPYPLPCVSTPQSDLFATPPPLSLVSASPASLCQTNATNVTVRGSGFISPGVIFTFDGATVQISQLSGCSNITYLSTLLRVCNTALLAFDPTAKPVGAVNIQVSNPAPFDCTQASSGILAVTAPPNVTSVTPSAFCAGDGGVLTITGMNFAATSQVTLRGSGLATYIATTTFVNESVLLAEFPANALASASYDVVVSTGAGCTSPGPGLIEVRPLVLVFFIDPPVTYNGIQLSATVYTSGLANEPTSIELVGPSNQTVVLTANSTALPNQNLVTLPAGLEAGSWSLRVLAETGCAGMASNVLTVAGNLTVHVESITPTFAYTGEALAVTVFSLAQPPAGFVNFSPVPRLYLTSGSGTNDATPTRAVEFVDNATLTAVIPSGVAVGTYDLVVVNPEAVLACFRKRSQ